MRPHNLNIVNLKYVYDKKDCSCVEHSNMKLLILIILILKIFAFALIADTSENCCDFIQFYNKSNPKDTKLFPLWSKQHGLHNKRPFYHGTFYSYKKFNLWWNNQEHSWIISQKRTEQNSGIVM